MNTVAVQIVTFNSARDIEACLHALVNQSEPISSICIVDNCSQDETLAIIESFKRNAKLPIHVVPNKKNTGFAAAHNQALEYSTSEYILIVNPDVALHPDYVYQLLLAAKQNKQIGSLTGKLLRKDNPEVIDSTGICLSKSRRAFDRGANEIDRAQYDKASDVFGVSGAAALYRREMIEGIKIDGQFYDEDFFAYKEDVDVAWRARLCGWESRFVPEALAYHKRGWGEGTTRKSIPLFIRQHSYLNRYLLLIKNDSIRFFLLHLPYILLYECMVISYILLKEPRILFSWLRFIKQWKKTVQKRKAIMKLKKVRYIDIYKFFT